MTFGEPMPLHYEPRWTRRPKHVRMTAAEKQQVYALAHSLPDHIYGDIGFNHLCAICNPAVTVYGRTEP